MRPLLTATCTGELQRILSSPKFAEVSGQWMTYWGEHAYLTLAMQHPEDDAEGTLVSTMRASMR